MTAYEEYKFNQADEVVAVIPALPQNVWAEQVFAFSEVLREEMMRFDELRQQDGDLYLDDGSSYVEGYENAAERLRNKFYEIFKISEVPAS